MLLATRCVLVLAVLLLSGCITTSKRNLVRTAETTEGGPRRIEWSIENRFRLLDGAAEEERFYRDVAAFAEEHREWARRTSRFSILPNFLTTDLLHRPRLPFGRANNNYATHYDEADLYQYDPAWVSSTRRIVLLDLITLAHPGADRDPRTETCIWIMERGGQSTEQSGRCTDFRVEVEVDEDFVVRGRRVGEPPEHNVEALVAPRNITIVALGDSLSSGEGNPHGEWRLLTLRPHAAQWLDTRCHRSLMSGQSLAAAYIARHNPHTSVTLLHYGCSGASIADGIVGPWAFMETAAVANRRAGYYAAFTSEEEDPPFQAFEPADIAPSQIAQAHRDLGSTRPDMVFVSAGINDIGFAGIIRAMTFDEDEMFVGDPIDYRRYAPDDEVLWAEAGACDDEAPSKVCVCRPNWGPTILTERERYLACMIARVDARTEELLGPDGRYNYLATALDGLVADDRVFINHYPSLLLRAPERGETPPHWQGELSVNAGFIACEDRAFDGRPGLIPGVFTWYPGAGVDEDAAAISYAHFGQGLNDAVAAAAVKHHWNQVDGHVREGMANGLCSHARYFNTFWDSLARQGGYIGEGRPIGLVGVRTPDEPPADDGDPIDTHDPRIEGVAPGQVLVWNPRGVRYLRVADTAPRQEIAACYTLVDEKLASDGDCLLRIRSGAGVRAISWDNLQACYVDDDHQCVAPEESNSAELMGEALPQQARDLSRLSDPNSAGAVHPTLYGHCSLAAAILRSLAERGLRQNDIGLDRTFLLQAGAVTHQQLCSAEGWGFRALPD